MKYNDILKQAKSLKTSVEKDQKFNINSKWIYYICKAIIKQADVKHIDFDKAPKPSGNYISRSVYKEDYMGMVEHLIDFVESRNRLPNFIKVAGKNVRVRDYGYAFARILIYIDTHKAYPAYVNINSKAFTKPTEYPNKVYGLWVKHIGTKPKYLDDVCDYIMKHFTYQFYYDDQKSNEEVLKTKAGNCTDLLQLLTNMADAMDYDWRVIHTQCRQSDVGHVYGQFKKKGTANWFTRDIACIADESRYCVWCEVPNGGNLLAKNPSWFLSNRQR